MGGPALNTPLEMLDDIEEGLMARSFLFVDPISYRDGVGAATRAVRVMLATAPPAKLQDPEPREERP